VKKYFIPDSSSNAVQKRKKEITHHVGFQPIDGVKFALQNFFFQPGKEGWV
jgi:hypothetical protein